MRNNLKNVAGVRHNAEMSRKRQSLLKKVLECVALLLVLGLILTGLTFGIIKFVDWLGFGFPTQMFVAFGVLMICGAIGLAIGADNDEL